MSELKQAWEYSFIHSSATGRGDEEIGPCLTYDKASAFGKGCIKQREVFIRTQPEATKPAQDLGAAIPDGWQLVPKAVTREMQKAYFDVIDKNMPRVMKDARFGRWDSHREAYKAMLAAALASPADALVAGDSETAKDAALEQAREALHVMLAQFTKTPSTLHDTEARCAAHEAISTINAAIQAQKDGHA